MPRKDEIVTSGCTRGTVKFATMTTFRNEARKTLTMDIRTDVTPCLTKDMSAITETSYARVGLLGNPSDGYFGKTISFSLKNYFAEVTLVPSERISFVAHPIHDPQDFESLESLVTFLYLLSEN